MKIYDFFPFWNNSLNKPIIQCNAIDEKPVAQHPAAHRSTPVAWKRKVKSRKTKKYKKRKHLCGDYEEKTSSKNTKLCMKILKSAKLKTISAKKYVFKKDLCGGAEDGEDEEE